MSRNYATGPERIAGAYAGADAKNEIARSPNVDLAGWAILGVELEQMQQFDGA